MFATQLVRRLKFPNTVRQFKSTARVYENKPAETKPPAVDPQAARDAQVKEAVLGARMYPVTKFDKWLFVLVKRYPNMAAVPEKVTEECLLGARSKGRIYACNVLIVISILGCLYAIYCGKQELKAGRTITQLGIERHRQLQEQGEAERRQREAQAQAAKQ